MLASYAWIRELCPIDGPVARVAEALTSRGLTVDSVTGGQDDAVLEINVPANRPDCLGHLGIARELSAAFCVPLAPRPAAPRESGKDAASLVTVRIDAPDLCARYSARVVRGVRVSPSPEWVARRLSACGLRPINNVVDASNLVLLELGHPIHTFDLTRVGEATIVVRRARPGERLVTLDGVERALTEGMLLIADPTHPLAVAGVMGGAGSEIAETTRDVLIEAAWFLPQSVRATARALALRTDASHRFERGVDPEGVAAAQDRAAQLLQEVAGGEVAPGIVDVRPRRPEPRTIEVRRERVGALLGYSPSGDDVGRALEPLGLKPALRGESGLTVTVPSWRVDLERDVDVVEEIARHLGYDRIPCRLPPGGGVPPPRQEIQEIEERVRTKLAHLGFLEAFCYSMIAAGQDDPFVPSSAGPALALSNPIAEPLSHLRRSLAPALVGLIDSNLRRGTRDARLFEVGRVFLPSSGLFPHEESRAAFVWTGEASPRHFRVPARPVSLAEAAGVMEVLIETARPGVRLRRTAPQGSLPSGFHPGKTALWVSGPDAASFDSALAWVAALHPDLARALDLDGGVFFGELNLEALEASPRDSWAVSPIPRFPAVSRDLSLILASGLPFARIQSSLGAVDSPAPTQFEVLDRYAGPPLAEGDVSLTVRVILQPLDRTLTDAEVEEYRARLVRHLDSDLGLKLRE